MKNNEICPTTLCCHWQAWRTDPVTVDLEEQKIISPVEISSLRSRLKHKIAQWFDDNNTLQYEDLIMLHEESSQPTGNDKIELRILENILNLRLFFDTILKRIEKERDLWQNTHSMGRDNFHKKDSLDIP